MTNRLSHTSSASTATKAWHGVQRLLPAPWRPTLRRWGQAVHTRHLEPSDVLLLSYPKSGSTWLRNMLAAGVAGNVQSPAALASWIPPLHEAKGHLIEPRIIRSHDSIVTPGFGRVQKVIFLVRDPRAVAVSAYWHDVRRGQPVESIEEVARQLTSSGISELGSWQSHAAAALSDERILLMRYEDLAEDPASELQRAIDFAGIEGCSGGLIQEILEATSPDSMRARRIEAGLDNANEAISGVRRADPFAWKSECPPAAQELIVRRARSEIADLGYLD